MCNNLKDAIEYEKLMAKIAQETKENTRSKVRETTLQNKSAYHAQIAAWLEELKRIYELTDTAEIQIQSHLTWIERDGYDGDVFYECPYCNDGFYCSEGTPEDNHYNFCPNCGARLIGN